MKGVTRLLVILIVLVASIAHADNELVKKAKALSANDFDKTLSDQPIEEWLQAHLPTSYKVVWEEQITDCGESTGTSIGKDRDMPLCAEVIIYEGPKVVGYLALFIATQKQGLLTNGKGLYFGFLDHQGTKYDFKQISDVLKVK